MPPPLESFEGSASFRVPSLSSLPFNVPIQPCFPTALDAHREPLWVPAPLCQGQKRQACISAWLWPAFLGWHVPGTQRAFEISGLTCLPEAQSPTAYLGKAPSKISRDDENNHFGEVTLFSKMPFMKEKGSRSDRALLSGSMSSQNIKRGGRVFCT